MAHHVCENAGEPGSSSGLPLKRCEPPSSSTASKRELLSTGDRDTGSSDSDTMLSSLLCDGLDRGQAQSASQAILRLVVADVAAAEKAALALADFVDSGHCLALANAGALERLLEAARTGAAAARALCKICTATAQLGAVFSSAQVSAAAVGIISALEHHPVVIIEAFKALAGIATELHTPLAADAAAALVSAIRRIAADREAASAGFAAVEALLIMPANRPLLHAAGISDVAIASLERHPGRRDVLLPSLRALTLLCRDAAAASDLSTAAGCKSLVAVLQANAGDAGIQRAALASITALAAALPGSAAIELVDAGAAAAVVSLLVTDGLPPPVLHAALAAVAAFSGCTTAAARLLKLFAADATAAALQKVVEQRALLDGLTALANLCELGMSRHAEVGQFRSDALLRSIVATTKRCAGDEAAALQGCKAINALADDSEMCESLMAAEAEVALVSVLRKHSGGLQVCLAACSALHKLCDDSSVHGPIIAAGAVAELVTIIDQLLRRGFSTDSPSSISSDSEWKLSGSSDEAAVLSCMRFASSALKALLSMSAAHVAAPAGVAVDRILRAVAATARSWPGYAAAKDCCGIILAFASSAEMETAHLHSAGAVDALVRCLRRFGCHRVSLSSVVCNALQWLSEKPHLPLDTARFRAVGAALTDSLLIKGASDNPDIDGSALGALDGLLADRAQAESHASWLCTYGAGEAVTAALLRLKLPSSFYEVRHACRALRALAQPLSCRLPLLRCGAVDALLDVVGLFCDDSEIVTDACAFINTLVREAPAAEHGSLADGSAFATLLHWVSKHAGVVDIVGPCVRAIACLAAIAPLSVRLDTDAAAKVIISAAAPLPEADVAFILSFATFLLQRRASAAGGTASLVSLPQLVAAQRRPANLAWAYRHGSASEVSSAVAAAATELFCNERSLTTFLVPAVRAGSAADVHAVLSQSACVGDGGKLARVALELAAARGSLPLVDDLLLHWRADPAAGDGSVLRIAAEHGHLALVEQLLEYPEVSPGAGEGAAIWAAARNGHLPVLERLLADPRADPSACHNAAIRMACRSGQLAVVQRLLADPRVDPDANAHAALEAAAGRCHLGLLEALLLDPRVDAVDYMRAIVADIGSVQPATAVHLPAASWYRLLRQPSVLRCLVQPFVAVAGGSEDAEDDGVSRGVKHVFAAADVHQWAVAAWRRRRHAVLAWADPASDAE